MHRFWIALALTLAPLPVAAQRGFVGVASVGYWRLMERVTADTDEVAQVAELTGQVSANEDGAREARLRLACDEIGPSIGLVGMGALGHGGMQVQWDDRAPEREFRIASWRGTVPSEEWRRFLAASRMHERLRVRLSGLSYTIDFQIAGANTVLDRLECFDEATLAEEIAAHAQGEIEARTQRPPTSIDDWGPPLLFPPPGFAETTVRPELRNPDDVRQATARAYPPVLREARISGGPMLWIKVGTDGTVEDVLLYESSGFSAMDEGGISVARAMRFSPAYNRDSPVVTWVQRRILFRAN